MLNYTFNSALEFPIEEAYLCHQPAAPYLCPVLPCASTLLHIFLLILKSICV